MELFFNCGSLVNFTAKELKCREELNLPKGETIEFDKPNRIDVNGNYWISVNNDVLGAFTEDELNSCVEFSEIKLQEVGL